MFSVIRTPHPSTGIEHSIQARFFGPWEDNLVVAGTDNLRVFRLVPDLEGQMALADRPKMKLECMASYQLFGEIMGLQKVSLPGSIRQETTQLPEVQTLNQFIYVLNFGSGI